MEILVTSLKNKITFKCHLRALCVVALFVLAAAETTAQTTPTIAPQSPASPTKPDSPDFGSRENEMRAKLILKDQKKKYDQHLERAREVSQIASQLSQRYLAKQAFNSEDGKRLERLEKLTKRIRNEAGGSDSDVEARDLPADTTAAVKRVAEMAESLRKLVEKTPRQVISTAVIEHANKLIGVIQFVRNGLRQGAS